MSARTGVRADAGGLTRRARSRFRWLVACSETSCPASTSRGVCCRLGSGGLNTPGLGRPTSSKRAGICASRWRGLRTRVLGNGRGDIRSLAVCPRSPKRQAGTVSAARPCRRANGCVPHAGRNAAERLIGNSAGSSVPKGGSYVPQFSDFDPCPARTYDNENEGCVFRVAHRGLGALTVEQGDGR